MDACDGGKDGGRWDVLIAVANKAVKTVPFVLLHVLHVTTRYPRSRGQLFYCVLPDAQLFMVNGVREMPQMQSNSVVQWTVQRASLPR